MGEVVESQKAPSEAGAHSHSDQCKIESLEPAGGSLEVDGEPLEAPSGGYREG